MPFELDYDQMIVLDAEELAEGGIAQAYAELLPKLSEYVSQPAEIEDVSDPAGRSYAVRYAGTEFAVYGPDIPDRSGESWGRAAYALFMIVNEQLAGSDYRLFAINGGNDLGGMFLTLAQAEAARDTLPRKQDWPYLPTNEHPWYGQHH